MRVFIRQSLVLVVFLLLQSFFVTAKVNPAIYGLPAISDTAAVRAGTNVLMDSFMTQQPQFTGRTVVRGFEEVREYTPRTSDFYLLIFLCLVLGLIRFSDPKYFIMLWRAFWNPTLSNRQLKDQLQSSGLSNILMNLFFTMSAGAYVYYVIRFFTPHRAGGLAPSLLLLLLIVGMMAIYSGKYLAVQFSGWAFKVEDITEHYLFNVFLINKIIAIVLIPFIILLAFANPIWVAPLAIVSFVAVGILLVNRYIRSWQVFGSFFQYSKFHFFTYICASELLPLAVLMKLVVNGMLFY